MTERLSDNLVRARWSSTSGCSAGSSTTGSSPTASAALDSIGLGVTPPLLEIAVLPVGISFFTFQAISYVIDVSARPAGRSWLDELPLYMSFFPHLVAGPIVRASEFAPQLHVSRSR